MIVAVTSLRGLQGLVELPGNHNLESLKAEFDRLHDPGPNPSRYGSEEQERWRHRVRERERLLLAAYGGEECGRGGITYGEATFVGWLLTEKGGRRVEFRELFLAEFD